MAVARITEVIGSSTKSWDDAVNNAAYRCRSYKNECPYRKWKNF